MKRLGKIGCLVLLGVSAVSSSFLAGCAAQRIATPEQIACPKPLEGNNGDYLCPITKDKVLAEWSDKMANVSMGASIGKTAGSLAGSYALKQVPFVGGILGDMAGKAIGRKIAIETAGGWEFIKDKSDLSFATAEEMALYLYVVYYDQEHYGEAIKAAMELYPDFRSKYAPAIVTASAAICEKTPCKTIDETICSKGPCR